MTWAALLLAAALVMGSSPAGARIRAVPAAVTAGAATRIRAGDPLAAASTFDLFAACLSAGMAVSSAARATAASAPVPLARLLVRAADLLALGADPSTAWSNDSLPQDNNAEALLRLARRSASSGTALAHGVAELATQSRHEAAAAADAAAERASVLIAGPLGLCYLPAFLCLGIVPVVAGLAGDVLGSGLL
ncbi:type II secretion system F family protein [Mycobacterium sp. 21AC1]|uniref:type II secretion system F family protein n=1 Tax=[Mycobacterium] appelbergii TaxID=2939269 RepID=UPI0029393CF1|nr:type II secretion system F family protein [Mycobacterium sp. 21AC1]MDV3124097.1 type II secretion system F family protein [Mycobacterium sp. 21AC1]